MAVDWKKLRAEYLKGGTSYRQLSAKYNVPLKTLARRAKAEEWNEHRLQVDNSVATEVNSLIKNRIAEGSVRFDLAVYDVAAELLELTRHSMRTAAAKEAVPPGELSMYASTLRSIKIAMQRPSELDIDEQKARIEKLRRESEDKNAGGTAITVRLEGNMDEYSG